MTRVFRVVFVLFAAGWLTKELLVPLGAAVFLSRSYIKLAHECDTAMEASWYMSQEDPPGSPSEVTQLLVCHDYDKTRKLLLMSGLPEEYLSWLGLKGLELYQRTPEEFIRQHRFTRR